MRNPRLLLVLLVLNLPVYAGIWRAFFGDWADLREALYFWLTPRWWDWLQGEQFEDTWANLKLLVFGLICGLTVVSEYVNLVDHFPHLLQ
jgi:hypothetical protein